MRFYAWIDHVAGTGHRCLIRHRRWCWWPETLVIPALCKLHVASCRIYQYLVKRKRKIAGPVTACAGIPTPYCRQQIIGQHDGTGLISNCKHDSKLWLSL